MHITLAKWSVINRYLCFDVRQFLRQLHTLPINLLLRLTSFVHLCPSLFRCDFLRVLSRTMCVCAVSWRRDTTFLFPNPFKPIHMLLYGAGWFSTQWALFYFLLFHTFCEWWARMFVGIVFFHLIRIWWNVRRWRPKQTVEKSRVYYK